jgi:hypothetical protein
MFLPSSTRMSIFSMWSLIYDPFFPINALNLRYSVAFAPISESLNILSLITDASLIAVSPVIILFLSVMIYYCLLRLLSITESLCCRLPFKDFFLNDLSLISKEFCWLRTSNEIRLLSSELNLLDSPKSLGSLALPTPSSFQMLLRAS